MPKKETVLVELPVKFDRPTLAKKAEEMAKIMGEIEDLEKKKKASNDDFKRQIDDCMKILGVMAEQVRGTATEPIKCRVDGELLVRMDTGEIVEGDHQLQANL